MTYFPSPDESPESYSLGVRITFHSAESRWQVDYEEPNGAIKSSVFSPLELTTLLAAIGTGRLRPRTESIEEALARGLQVTFLPTRFAFGGDHRQNRKRLPFPEVKTKAERKASLKSLTLEDLGL